tara:strand:- start:3091 stop:3243 length:153 start_codon:yes stop_codon:yes gene_type:complete
MTTPDMTDVAPPVIGCRLAVAVRGRCHRYGARPFARRETGPTVRMRDCKQ